MCIVACNLSNDPATVIDLTPSENDPKPYFRIGYSRENTEGSSGMIENVQFYLSHIVNSKSVDYGNISFGGLELNYTEDFYGDYYFNYLQTGIPGLEFRPEFRFDMGYLLFEAKNSTLIENINLELHVPPVNYIINVIQGQIITPYEDWLVEINNEVRNAQIILWSIEPSNGDNSIFIEINNKSSIIPDTLLQKLQNTSLSEIYYIRFYNYQRSENDIIVRGIGSNKTINVPVSLECYHDIEFKIENP